LMFTEISLTVASNVKGKKSKKKTISLLKWGGFFVFFSTVFFGVHISKLFIIIYYYLRGAKTHEAMRDKGFLL